MGSAPSPAKASLTKILDKKTTGRPCRLWRYTLGTELGTEQDIQNVAAVYVALMEYAKRLKEHTQG